MSQTHWAAAREMPKPGKEHDPTRVQTQMADAIDRRRAQEAPKPKRSGEGKTTLGDLIREKMKVDPGIAGDVRELKRTLPTKRANSG